MSKDNQLAAVNSTAIFPTPFDTQFSSFSPDDRAGKIKLFNAINSPDHRLSDMINKPILIKDVVLVKVEMTDEREPGDDTAPEKREGVRTIIIDENGESYSATSNGIFNSIQIISNVFGTLHFDEPLEVMVSQVKVKRGSTLKLTITA